MRVSKTIKEYLEAQLKKKAFASPELAQLKEKADTEAEAFKTEMEALKEETLAKASEIIEKHDMKYAYGENKNGRIVDFYINSWNTPASKESRDFEINLRNAVADKLNDIVISLELGGTKEDLERYIQEVSFE